MGTFKERSDALRMFANAACKFSFTHLSVFTRGVASSKDCQSPLGNHRSLSASPQSGKRTSEPMAAKTLQDLATSGPTTSQAQRFGYQLLSFRTFHTTGLARLCTPYTDGHYVVQQEQNNHTNKPKTKREPKRRNDTKRCEHLALGYTTYRYRSRKKSNQTRPKG